MTQVFQKFTQRYLSILGVLIGLAVVSSILIYSGCGMTSSPNLPTPTRDTTPPTSTITAPTVGAIVPSGIQVAITGTASDAGGGSVARVEVSVDGGANYSAATGTNAWSFNWKPSAPGSVTIRSRAVDNTGNVQNPPAEIHVTVVAPPTSTITSPTEGAFVPIGKPVAITGTASATGGGSVARVEVSVDGGAGYSAAMGTNAWSFSWTPSAPGPATIKSRAVDTTGNVQNPPAEIAVTVRDSITVRVPSDRPTIQSAIDFAIDGDTVLVAPGTYRETINFRGKAITVRSDSGRPQDTIIDGGNADSVVIFNSGEQRDSVLNGFTLQKGFNFPGFNEGEGGGITVQGSSPTITNNLITNNQACSGGGIGIRDGSPLIQLNTITSNSTATGLNCFGSGGGISVTGASFAEILDNVISDNIIPSFGSGGGIAMSVMSASGTSIVKGNIIKGNNIAQSSSGGGIAVKGPALIVQNLIVGNRAGRGAGIDLAGGPILVNNTIADNDALQTTGSGITATGSSALTNNIIVAKPGQSALFCSASGQTTPTIRFNNSFSAGGIAYSGPCLGMDNISADPLFTNPNLGDYHLQQGSPSIDSGDNLAPNLPDKDLDGNPRIQDGDGLGTATIDMGVYEARLRLRLTSRIGSLIEGDTVLIGNPVAINGSASAADGGPVVRVEVSVDGGATYSAATGTNFWSFNWTFSEPGPVTIKSRAVDNSGNVQDPPTEVHITVNAPGSRITSPTRTIRVGTPVVITGTASAASGRSVARVEVSVRLGSYMTATGTNDWSFNWTPSVPGPVTIRSRAVDNTGTVQNPPFETLVTVDGPPTSHIDVPREGAKLLIGRPVTIFGGASDTCCGRVVKLEVSVDGGASYSDAGGHTPGAWRFDWTPSALGPVTIKSRAFDDTGFQEDPPAEIHVIVKENEIIRVPTTEHPTIQSAIDDTTDGDTVLVAPGTYRENIDFGGRAITVTSESGQPQDTIIDGGNTNSVVTFNSREERDSVLNGFTLQNGRSFSGGGITVVGSSPTITNNIIKNNQACFGAGLIINDDGILDASPLIQRNTIQLNTTIGYDNNSCSSGAGGGIIIFKASAVEILDNVISDNSSSKGGGIYLSSPPDSLPALSGAPAGSSEGGISRPAASTVSMAGPSIIKGNIIRGNNAMGGQGGGILMSNVFVSDALIIQNLITGNQAGTGGGIYLEGFDQQILVNNTIADNDSISGSGIFVDGGGGRGGLLLYNNIIVANPGQVGLYCGNLNPLTVQFNNIFSAGGIAYGGTCSDQIGMNGNISADPLFTNPTLGDYHLQQGSPSIDSGDNQTPFRPDTDLDGNSRIQDSDGDGTATIDMGVYEFLLPPSFKISLLDKSNHSPKNSRALFICDLRPWARTPRSPRLRLNSSAVF